jgi:hypothetical protein
MCDTNYERVASCMPHGMLDMAPFCREGNHTMQDAICTRTHCGPVRVRRCGGDTVGLISTIAWMKCMSVLVVRLAEILEVETLWNGAVADTSRPMVIFNGELDRMRNNYYPPFIYRKITKCSKEFVPKVCAEFRFSSHQYTPRCVMASARQRYQHHDEWIAIPWQRV